jgi:2-C-methyl-D-erythritol 2,4-cyclodiphosphate synthase
MSESRVGIGYDVHALQTDIPLVIGGVQVESGSGLAGDSDGDVLTHAVMDALLGAAGLGDLGEWFRPDDPTVKGARSLDLLRRVLKAVLGAGWRIVNVDSTVVAQTPRLSPYRAEMRRVLADALGVETERVSIKATTPDHLGAIGRAEGIAAQAVVLLERSGSTSNGTMT